MCVYILRNWSNVVWGALVAVWGDLMAVWVGLVEVWGGLVEVWFFLEGGGWGGFWVFQWTE